jgi:hypothetical protein
MPALWENESQWIIEHSTYMHPVHGEVTISNYSSPAIPLMKGAAHFTKNIVYHLPFPKDDNAILSTSFTIVDGAGSTQTPLSEVYNHHWLIGTRFGPDPLVACEDNLFIGAGAEMRGMPVVYPHGHANVRIGSKGSCGGNLHFIRTEDLNTSWTGMNDPAGNVHAAVKNCIECGWAPGRAAECLKALDGNFACCLTGSRCPVNNPQDTSTQDYRLNCALSADRTRDLHEPHLAHPLPPAAAELKVPRSIRGARRLGALDAQPHGRQEPVWRRLRHL